MGHGPSRELAQGGDDVAVELGAGHVARLDTALQKLDRLDPKFKAARDEERFAQMTKVWHKLCAELDGHLRTAARVLIRSHQLNLDIGSEGGGIKARPWIEEMSQVFERLHFQLEGQDVLARCGPTTVAAAKIREVDYAWVEGAVVEWIVTSIERRR